MTLCYLERKFPQIFHHPIYCCLTSELLQQITILRFESKPQFAILLFLNRTLNLILGPKLSKHPFYQIDRQVISN